MATAGDLVVNLSANTAKFTGGINKARGDVKSMASASNSSMSSMLGPIAGVAAGYLSISAAVGVMTSSMAAAREAAQISKKFGAVLDATGNAAGLTSDQYDAMAGSLQRLTNFDDDAATNAMAGLAKFGTISGDQFKRALPLAADLASVMETDLTSAAQTLGKALSDPERGMVALEKSVGRFTATQRATIEEMTKAGDIAGAQGAIMDALAAKVGGAAEKMADSFTQLGNTVDNVFESIGVNVMEALKGVTEQAGGDIDTLGAKIDTLKPKSREFGEEIGAAYSLARDLLGPLAEFTKDIPTTLDFLPKLSDIKAAKDYFTGATEPTPAGEILDASPTKMTPLQKQMEDDAIAKAVSDNAKKMLEDMQFSDIYKDDGGNMAAMQSAIDDMLVNKIKPPPAKDFGADEFLRLGSIEPKKIGGNQSTQFAGALEQGSQAAYSAFVKAMGASADVKVAKEQLAVLKEIKKQGITQKTPDLTVIERLA